MRHLIKSFIPIAWRRRYWSYCVQRERFEVTARALGSTVAKQLLHSSFSLRRRLSVHLPGYDHPIGFRPRTSDVHVIHQVFVDQEYRPVAELDNVRLIVDCGANIGCTAFYLLKAYPKANIVVVEPDPGNMALCRENLRPFGDRVMFVEGGVWSESVPLRVVRGEFRDGECWSYQVRPCSPGELSDLTGVTITELLDRVGADCIDLLKMDIEGAERHVFQAADSRWLARTRNIAVELHDDASTRIFDSAIRNYDCYRMRSGELTVCIGLAASESSGVVLSAKS